MRALVFLICFLFASTAFAQCPGGVCARPTKSVLKTVTKTAQKTVAVQPVRKVLKVRLFRRWR